MLATNSDRGFQEFEISVRIDFSAAKAGGEKNQKPILTVRYKTIVSIEVVSLVC